MAGELRPVVGYRRTLYERAWLCATTDLGHLAAMLARVVPPDHRCAVCVLPFGVDCLSVSARPPRNPRHPHTESGVSSLGGRLSTAVATAMTAAVKAPEAAEQKGHVSVRLVTNGWRRVVNLDIAGRLAFGSRACAVAGHGRVSCQGCRRGGNREGGSTRSQQGCDVASSDSHVDLPRGGLAPLGTASSIAYGQWPVTLAGAKSDFPSPPNP